MLVEEFSGLFEFVLPVASSHLNFSVQYTNRVPGRQMCVTDAMADPENLEYGHNITDVTVSKGTRDLLEYYRSSHD